MARLHINKTSFTAGELSPRLLGRGDLKHYENGAARLRNVFIHPTGGLSRRGGLRYVATAPGRGRLVPFEFNTEQAYVLVFTGGRITVFRDEVEIDAVTDAPWTETQVSQINWTQSADTLIVVHPDVEPRIVYRNPDETWSLQPFAFYADSATGRIEQPYHKFAGPAVTVQPSGTSGTVTLTASAAAFEAGHGGTRFRVNGGEVQITSVASATSALASVEAALADTTASDGWSEAAFSPVRGWPGSVCFHQDRMVIGGSRDLPNRLWMSRSGELFNFDTGEGEDDEAIDFAILSDQVNGIRHVFPGRHLQVFTTGGEWMVSGEPLTPTNIQLKRQTRIGSPIDRTVPPRDVDGATLFVPRGGGGLHEFLFADVEQAYQAVDLALTARHLMDRPLDQDYDRGRRLLDIVMADGTMATVTMFRSEQVTAWTRQETRGDFLSVAVAGDAAYVLVDRENGVCLEVLDDALAVDSGLFGSSATPADQWGGLDHLEGRTVKVLADGAVRADAVVEGGIVTLDEPASAVQIGLAFTHVVEALPPGILDAGAAAQGGRVRPVAITLRLHETPALRMDTGRGVADVPFKAFGGAVLDAPPLPFTGDKTVRAFGWRRTGTDPLWRIEHDTPLPFTLLSAATEVAANI